MPGEAVRRLSAGGLKGSRLEKAGGYSISPQEGGGSRPEKRVLFQVCLQAAGWQKRDEREDTFRNRPEDLQTETVLNRFRPRIDRRRT